MRFGGFFPPFCPFSEGGQGGRCWIKQQHVGRDEPNAGSPLPAPSQPGPSQEDAVSSPPCPGINRPTGPAVEEKSRFLLSALASLLPGCKQCLRVPTALPPPLPQPGNRYNCWFLLASLKGSGTWRTSCTSGTPSLPTARQSAILPITAAGWAGQWQWGAGSYEFRTWGSFLSQILLWLHGKVLQ